MSMTSRRGGRAALRALLILVLFGGTGTAIRGGPQAPEVPTFSSQVELITVDAVVLDANGRPVAGLSREDFRVTEDGRAREIVSFEAFEAKPDLDPATPVPEPAVVKSNETPPETGSGRAFTILIDDVRLLAARTEAVREAVTRFLDREAREGDEVTISTSSGEVFWSARIPEGREDLLAVLDRVTGRDRDDSSFDRMTEYEAYRIANFEDAPGYVTTGPGPLQSVTTGGAPAAEAPKIGSLRERVSRRWAEANLCTPPSCDPNVVTRAGEIDARRRDRMRVTLRAARRAMDALGLVHGRKSLLLISDGFIQDEGVELREVAAYSRLANVAVYFLDARGLVVPSGFGGTDVPSGFAEPSTQERGIVAFEEVTLATGGSQTLADETGGFSVRGTNDLSLGMARIGEESRVFYLLGFAAPEGGSPRTWRKLQVAVTRPSLSVRARRGYSLSTAPLAPAPKGKEAKDERKAKGKGPKIDAPPLQRALDSVHEARGIPLRSMVYLMEPRGAAATRVVVGAELDASQLTLKPRGAARVGAIDVSVVATYRDTGRGFRHDDRVEPSFAAGEPVSWRALVREFELAPGVARIQIVVRDVESGALGSLSHRIEVPPSGILRLSTPVLSDRVEPGADEKSRPRPAMAFHRHFRPEGGLYVQFEVFGAALRGGQAAPQVSAGLEVRTSDGRVVRRADPTPIAADSGGRLVRTVGMGLDGLEEGRYDLVLKVRDEVRGADLERREPFSLSREVAR